LEDLQDAFDFAYKVHYLPGEDSTNDPHRAQQVQVLQGKLQMLDRQRREVLAQMQQLLGRSETLRDFLQQELEAWQERQRRSCMGAPADTRLRPLEAWFTELGQGLFQLLQLLQLLQDLRQKLTYERDPLKAETPLLERRLRELLSYLLKSAFVVEQQPCMPNASKRPLVLRTGTKFSARARLLVRLHDRSHRMEAKIHIDRLGTPSPFLPQNELAPLKGPLSWGIPAQPRWVSGRIGLAADALFHPAGTPPRSKAFSLLPSPSPLVPLLQKEQQFFSKPPPAPWPLLAEVLSWQFQSVAERGLDRDHLLMLGKKLFG
ncbi:STAT2 protein, partial [Eubucco bourcierii]|nr:STAT2 protein [Eubucco bourcierii]